MKLKAAILLSTALLAGCVTGRPLREMVMDSNRIVARTSNEQTLLNILRAKDRMPMHYTSFTALNGNISISGTADFSPNSVVRTEDADEALTSREITRKVPAFAPNIGVTMKESPSFEMALYDTKEFTNGILAPVDPQTIELYLERGWPENYLTAVMINSVTLQVLEQHEDEVAVTETIPNSARPNNVEFIEFIHGSTMERMAAKRSETVIASMADFKPNMRLEGLSSLLEAGYTVKKGKIVRPSAGSASIYFSLSDKQAQTYYKSLRKQKHQSFLASKKLIDAIGEANKKIDSHNAGSNNPMLKRKKFSVPQIGDRIFSDVTDEARLIGHITGAALVKKRPKLFDILRVGYSTRAPDGIMYFLGKYVREHEELFAKHQGSPECKEGGYVIERRFGNSCYYIIKVVQGASSDRLIRVGYRDEVYSVPDSEGENRALIHRGAQSIALVQQLINLQKQADKLPTSRTVRIQP